ncbi:MAG: TnsD family Tn7-like transposition protein [Parvularcula sp.]|nr:TnsD family Tn7-like transposition protein [Parvularcula sp.]
MEAEYGDLWWLRAHQLPGVLFCPLHHEILRTSLVDPGEARHAFVAATRANCPGSAPPVIDNPSDSLIEQLRDLAIRSAALLHHPPSSRNYKEIRSGYLEGLTRVGLMRSPERVDHLRLYEAFRDRWGEIIGAIPALALGSEPGSSWLSRLVQNGRRAAPPTHHVMLKALIEDLAAVPQVHPFGPGPWNCRNPIAQHHGQPVIEKVKLRRDRGMIYGDFTCDCGYLFTRSLSLDGHVGEPRYRRFGPLLAPALTKALHDGKGLRATARMLGLDPRTLIREAKGLGILVPWTTTPSGNPKSVPQRRPTKSPTRGAARRKPSRNRRNWFAIDSRLSRSARDAVLTIRASEPPVRVTFAEIERRIARRDWVRKRCIKLPRTFELMVESQEATDEFRHRRLAWHVSKAFASREVIPWKITREAGLPSHWVDEVRMHIKRTCRPGTDESLAA